VQHRFQRGKVAVLDANWHVHALVAVSAAIAPPAHAVSVFDARTASISLLVEVRDLLMLLSAAFSGIPAVSESFTSDGSRCPRRFMGCRTSIMPSSRNSALGSRAIALCNDRRNHCLFGLCGHDGLRDDRADAFVVQRSR